MRHNIRFNYHGVSQDATGPLDCFPEVQGRALDESNRRPFPSQMVGYLTSKVCLAARSVAARPLPAVVLVVLAILIVGSGNALNIVNSALLAPIPSRGTQISMEYSAPFQASEPVQGAEETNQAKPVELQASLCAGMRHQSKSSRQATLVRRRSEQTLYPRQRTGFAIGPAEGYRRQVQAEIAGRDELSQMVELRMFCQNDPSRHLTGEIK